MANLLNTQSFDPHALPSTEAPTPLFLKRTAEPRANENKISLLLCTSRLPLQQNQ